MALAVKQVTEKQLAESSNQLEDIIKNYTNNVTQVKLPIVPVKEYNLEITKSIWVYALLDRGSAGTFCTEFLTNE